jgi:bis(5'-nucleosyl)-tetraphosphatase (symmetrical)
MRNKNTPNLDNDQSKERPWFSWSHRASRQMRIVFGHWSTLGYYTNGEVYALDTGCVWGGALTALCLENQQVTNISCPKTCAPGDE